jgi:hypothetical protein
MQHKSPATLRASILSPYNIKPSGARSTIVVTLTSGLASV